MRTLVLDTCIVQYLFRSESRKAMDELLACFRKQHDVGIFMLSKFTKFELLRGARRVQDTTKYLEGFKKTEVLEDILTLAAFLYSACQNVNKRQISDGDCIIGATAFFLQDCLLATGDGDGFPRPFFVEIDRGEIVYKKGGRERSYNIFLLKPNWKALTDGLNEHIGKRKSS